MTVDLVEFRCECGRLICKVADVPGQEIEARCARCKTLTRAKLEEPAPSTEATR